MYWVYILGFDSDLNRPNCMRKTILQLVEHNIKLICNQKRKVNCTIHFRCPFIYFFNR